METQITVFEQAKEIYPGDIFTPTFDSVEGRDKVILTKDGTIKELLEKYDKQEIGLDAIIAILRALTGDDHINFH